MPCVIWHSVMVLQNVGHFASNQTGHSHLGVAINKYLVSNFLTSSKHFCMIIKTKHTVEQLKI